jgi:hypothetical protein
VNVRSVADSNAQHGGTIARAIATIAVLLGLVALGGYFGVRGPDVSASASPPVTPIDDAGTAPSALSAKPMPFNGPILNAGPGEVFVNQPNQAPRMGLPIDVGANGVRCEGAGCFAAEIVANPDGGAPRVVYGLTTVGEPQKPRKKE